MARGCKILSFVPLGLVDGCTLGDVDGLWDGCTLGDVDGLWDGCTLGDTKSSNMRR